MKSAIPEFYHLSVLMLLAGCLACTNMAPHAFANEVGGKNRHWPT